MKTIRDFLTAIINGTEITEEMKNFATTEIEKLDERNERRRKTPTKTQIANAEIAEQIYNEMGTEVETASSITQKFNLSSPSKATAIMKLLAKDNKIEITEVKIKGKGKVNGYKKIIVE